MEKVAPWLYALPLTMGSRPVLVEKEVEVLISPGTSLFYGDDSLCADANGVAHVTTHRLLWIQEGGERHAFQIPLENVHGVEDISSFWKGSELKVQLRSLAPKVVTAGPGSSPPKENNSNSNWPPPIPPRRPLPSTPVISAPSRKSCSVCTFDNVPSASKCEMCGTDLLALIVHQTTATLAPSSSSSSSTPSSPAPTPTLPPSPGFMKLYISSKDEKNNLLAHLQKALDRKAWVTKEEEKHPTTKVSHGIQGIIRTVEREHIAAESTLKGAFSDLQSLMTHAETVAGMAEKFVAVKERMEKQQAASSLSGNNSANNNNSSRDAAVVQQSRQEDEEMDAILHGLGIKSPVTKQFAGAAYHTQLAGQLADFLQIPLQRAGGMMTLTDVYCIFCRARGTEMISPEDLLRAADLFPQQRIPFRLRKFTHSGVLVIQDESYSDAAICKTIVGLLESKGPMTSAEVAAAARISLLLAKQHLNTAETSCLICRDESFEGLKYFPNLFRRRLQ